jgi:predicted esterase
MQKPVQTGEIQLFEADNEIKYDYLVYIPQNLKKGKIILWCHGSTPPDPNDDLKSYALRSLTKIQKYCDELGLVAIMPVLPSDKERETYPYWKYDSQIMAREVMTTPLDPVDNIYFRPDTEVLKIVTEVKSNLTSAGISVSEKIIAGGFSAGGTFSNRFSLLYPEVVESTILLCAGLFIYPTAVLENKTINYPFGIADIDVIQGNKFSIETFRQIRQFIYVGELETNTDHDILPFETNGDPEMLNYIGEMIGYESLTRTKNYVNYLREIGSSVELFIGEGLGHQANGEIYDRAFRYIA